MLYSAKTEKKEIPTPEETQLKWEGNTVSEIGVLLVKIPEFDWNDHLLWNQRKSVI